MLATDRFGLIFGGGFGEGGDYLAGGGDGFLGEGGSEGRFWVGMEGFVGDWIHLGEDGCGGNGVLTCISYYHS